MSSLGVWCGNKTNVPNWVILATLVTLVTLAIMLISLFVAASLVNQNVPDIPKHTVSQQDALEYLLWKNVNQSEAPPDIAQVLKNCDKPCCSDPKAPYPSVVIMCGQNDSSEYLEDILYKHCREEIWNFGRCDNLQQKRCFKICKFSNLVIAHYFIHPCLGRSKSYTKSIKPNCSAMPKCKN